MEYYQPGSVGLPSDTLELFREYSFAFDLPAPEGSEPGAAPAFASPFDRPSQEVRNARSHDLPIPLTELNPVPPLRRSSSLPSDLSFLKSLATLPGLRHDLAAPVAGCLPSSLNLTEYRDGLPASADLRMLPDKCTEPSLAAGVRQSSRNAAPQTSSNEASEEPVQQPGPRSKLLGAVYEACRSSQRPEHPVAATIADRMRLRSQALNIRSPKRQRTGHQRREAQRSHSWSQVTPAQMYSDATSPADDQLNVAAGGVMKVEGRPMQISWPRRSSPPPARELRRNRVAMAPATASSSSSGQAAAPEASTLCSHDTFDRPFRVQLQTQWGPSFWQGQQYGRQYDALQEDDQRFTNTVQPPTRARPNRIVTRCEWGA